MNKRYILPLMLIISCLVYFSTGFSKVKSDQSDYKPFDEIISRTGSEVIEYGITTCFETEDEGKNVCSKMLQDMQFDDGRDVSVFEIDNVYRIEFQKGMDTGYIESIKDDKKSIIKIHIVESSKTNNIDELKIVIENVVKKKYPQAKYFKYIKCKIPDCNTDKLNKSLVKLLKEHGASNVYTVPIDKGFSTIAYTGIYEPINNNRKLMDFNFAICRYSSGTYIVMGTPEILETY